MQITHFALKPIQVGDDLRQPGDLVPEARSWPFLAGYVRDGHLAPVLVATLPEDVQAVLAEWEADQSGATVQAATPTPPATETTSTPTQGDGTAAAAKNKKEKVA